MAYNYYQPMGYTPMYNQQPLPQPQPQIQPQAYANTGIVWASSRLPVRRRSICSPA